MVAASMMGMAARPLSLVPKRNLAAVNSGKLP
jgi:hypothetical protein